MKNLLNQIQTTMSNISSAAQHAKGDVKSELDQMAARLTKGLNFLKKKNVEATQRHKGPKKGNSAARATETVTTTGDQMKDLQDNFAQLFADNPEKKVVFYTSFDTRAQRRQITAAIRTASKFGYPTRLGITAEKIQVIVAQKKETITAKPAKGFVYVTAVKNGVIQGLDQKLLSTKVGQMLVNAVKPIQGKKFAMPAVQVSSEAPQRRQRNNPKKVAQEPVSRATEPSEAAEVAASGNGTHPPVKALNPLDPAALKTQKPATAAAAN